MTITADFSGGGKTVTTEPLYQWDTGQKLALSGLPATSTDIQVHFANAAMAQAIVKATELVDSLPTCDIPNEFLQYGSAAKARAWVFYRTSNTEGYTVRTVLIPVTPRKRPNDYVSPEDPDSKGIVERAIELLENYQSDLDSKLDDSDGSVKTANLDGGAVTEAKLAQAVKDIINAKEVKSNKKTTLTGNESSNDYYPTTKAVADALSTKAPASTAYTFDSTTTEVPFDVNNPKIIYLNAVVDGESGIVITSAHNASNASFQIFFGRNGTTKIRYFTGGTSYSDWIQVTELVGNKKNSITNANKTSTTLYPSIKAVVDYLTANYIGNGNNTVSWDNLAVAVQTLINGKESASNKLTSEAGIDENSTDTEYPTAKAVFDFGVQILDDVAGDLVLKENLSNKKNAIAGNETSKQYYPSIKAVVDYIAANYEALSNKLSSEEGIDSSSTDTEYPSAKAVYDLGVEILALVNDDISNVESRLVLKESASNKQSSITAVNKASTTLYPSIKAVVDYLVANYENLSNKKTTLTGNESSNDFYPTTKAVADALLGINAGSVGFDETGTYADGSIGAGVSNQKNALNFTNQGALDYALNYDIDLFKFLKWTKGQYVDDSNGNILNNSRFYISDPIEVSDLKSGYLHLVITNSFTFKYAQYDANGDFLLGSSYSSAVDRVLSIQDTCKTIRFSVGAWSGTYTLSDYLNAITIYVKPAHNVVIEDYIGCKELDFLYDNYIVTPSVSTANVSTTPVSFNQCVCLSTPCTKGQIFTITGTPRDNSGSRPVMFLDQANMCIYRSDEASAFNNVEITAPVTGTLVVNFLKAYPFQCYTGFKNLSEKVFKNLDSVNTIKSFPVDLIPDWLTNAMAIRTVGPLQKGYICLTCDDGYTELESYTIPMLLNKQVPCTFGLWASTSKVGAEHPFNKSPVLQTPSGIAAVKNAITAGCSVAQHGAREWTDMTNEELNEFFDREAAAWEALDINVKGAICPSHCINNAVRVTAGGRFGVVRSGYLGYLSKADQQAVINGDVFAKYKYYCAGPRSNVFGLSSFNTNAVTLSWMKGAVDYAIAQKMILVAYWHDWDLTAEQKSDLEAFIDYAKAQNITFCTLGEIPFLA